MPLADGPGAVPPGSVRFLNVSGVTVGLVWGESRIALRPGKLIEQPFAGDERRTVLTVLHPGPDGELRQVYSNVVEHDATKMHHYGINVKPETTDGWQPFFLGVRDNPGLSNLQPFLRVTTAILEPTEFDNYVASLGAAGMNLADDSDKDGILAVVEYALGLDPTRFDVLPGLVADGNDFTLTFDKGAAAANDSRVSYAIEISNDLVNWTDQTPVEDATRISATIPGPAPDRPKTFGRLRIDYQQ